jgi:crotonobetainyl-CoA:carnitine CoA-transferase CaiB-like acyl-CoA transferase
VRILPPFGDQEGVELGVNFRALNAGKRSIALDLKTTEGRALFQRLVEQADVVLDGFRPGVLERLGVGSAACREKNPRLVFATLTGFGESGPYRDRAGHDLTYQAFAGSLDNARDERGTSVVPGVQLADMSGALSAFSGIVLALLAREKTGKGRHVAASLMGSAVALQPLQLVPAARGERADGAIALSGQSPCYRVYRTKDGRSVALAALEPKFWDVFCELVDRPEWLGRGHDTSVLPELTELFASKTWEEWRLLEDSECCLAGVLSPGDVARDPQVEALGLIVAGPDGKAVRLAPPVALEGVAPGSTRAPVRPGEHTAEVLKEKLGIDDDAFRSLRERGVVA